jgi:hypothetical protein
MTDAAQNLEDEDDEYLDATIDIDEEDSDDEDDEGCDEDNIVAYPNSLHDCIVSWTHGTMD